MKIRFSKFDCGQANKTYTIGRTDINSDVAIPELEIEIGYTMAMKNILGGPPSGDL